MNIDSNEEPKFKPNRRHYKYYDLVMAAFVTVLLCSNLIGPGKSCVIPLPFTIPFIGSVLIFGAGNMFFPISYIFDDVLTEVYGYARSRKVIWAGFGAMVFATIMSFVVVSLPVNTGDEFNAKTYAPAVAVVFGGTWRIALASLMAFWVGDFLNSYVMAKMKIWTSGRFLWMRTIGSTIVGEGADSVIFYPLAFASFKPIGDHFGITLPESLSNGWAGQTLVATVIFNWVFKVIMEVLFTPLTYLICGWLKRAENEDYFDHHTDFTPFSLKD